VKGQVIIIRADGGATVIQPVTKPPGLDVLQRIVGGYIEQIGGFTSYAGFPAVAFADEEGKLKGKPFNALATEAWKIAKGSDPGDELVGDVAVLTGDADFMEAL
jgi:hypothetical protein